MKQWRWALIILELLLFAVVLVLPQVDLPDFTFHGATAPIVAKSRMSPPPALSTATVQVRSQSPRPTRSQPVSSPIRLNTRSLLFFFCALLC